MKNLFGPLLVMLRDWITSKKVLTAVLTAVAGALIKDPVLRDRVIAIGLALLGGQALTDVGKAKAVAPPLPPASPPPIAFVPPAVSQAIPPVVIPPTLGPGGTP